MGADLEPRRISLADGGALSLGAEGFRLFDAEGERAPIHSYDAIGHVYASERLLLIGTEEELITLRAEQFADGAGPEAARDALFEAIGALPEGRAILDHIAAVERLGEHEGPPWMIWATAAICALGMVLQYNDRLFDQVGLFVPDLFVRGEYWRAITMHFLHDVMAMPGFMRALLPMFDTLPLHLMLNVAGLLILGNLVERPLGHGRTVVALAFSGIGTLGGIVLFDHGRVLGASGLVAGLAGAMLALELHHARFMPAYWRVPRRLFIILLVVQFCVIDQLLARWVAGGAHIGGFAGGYLATWLIGRPSVEDLESPLGIRVAAWSTLSLVVVGFLGALPLARHDMPALERHAVRVWDLPFDYYRPRYDNAAAWFIATEDGPSEDGLELAVALAERAVNDTAGLNPNVLDTLAEALFQRGRADEAVYTIDAAIALAPQEPYFREQRKRFTGERDPSDRPPAPGLPIPWDTDEGEAGEGGDPETRDGVDV